VLFSVLNSEKCSTTDIGVNIGVNRDQLIITIYKLIHFSALLKAVMTEQGVPYPTIC
jgi:hypothetical protein